MRGFLKRLFTRRRGEEKQFESVLRTLLGIVPNDIKLYEIALIHRSSSLELGDGKSVNNERLEFLGDAVLDTIVSEYLFVEYPKQDEGFLTQMRARIVSRQSLNELSFKIGLAEHVVFQDDGNHTQKHLYGDALEAIIGAAYLDRGYEYARSVVLHNILKAHIDLEDVKETETDFKSRLIEWCQKSKHTISFDTSEADDSTAQNPAFKSVVVIDDMELGYGLGDSKKEAEQMASCTVSQLMSDELGDSLMEWVDERLHSNGNGGANGAKNDKRE